jgi:hypothetical protein
MDQGWGKTSTDYGKKATFHPHCLVEKYNLKKTAGGGLTNYILKLTCYTNIVNIIFLGIVVALCYGKGESDYADL